MNETRRLYRSETDKMLAGICGGVGEYFNVDPTIVRVGFVLATFFAGVGPVLYVVMWIVVPRRSRLDAPANETAREAVDEVREQAQRGVQEARSAYERWRSGSSASREAGGPPGAGEAGGPPEPGPSEPGPPEPGPPEVGDSAVPPASGTGPDAPPDAGHGGSPGEEPPGDRR